MFQYTPYVLPLLVTVVILCALGVCAWRRRACIDVPAFVVTMLATLIWTAGFALEISSVGLPAKVFWVNVQFIGITTLPLAWLALTIDYTGRARRLKRLIPALALVPLVTNVLIWSNDFHHLFRGRPTLDTTSGPFPILVDDYGPWFYGVSAPFGLSIFLVSLVLLLRALLSSRAPFRKQTAVLLCSTILPLLTGRL